MRAVFLPGTANVAADLLSRHLHPDAVLWTFSHLGVPFVPLDRWPDGGFAPPRQPVSEEPGGCARLGRFAPLLGP